MNLRDFPFENNRFSKNATGLSKICHEVLFLMKLLQTKPQVRNMNFIYYESYYTVIKNRYENEIVNDKFEDNDKDYFSYEDFITPNHYSGRKNINEILR